jgi:hypothetical protein
LRLFSLAVLWHPQKLAADISGAMMSERGAMEAIVSAKITTKLVPPAPRRMVHYNILQCNSSLTSPQLFIKPIYLSNISLK